MTDTPTTPPTPEGGEPSEKPKNWVQRHPVWASVLAAIVVVIGISAAAGGADEGDSGNRSDDEMATTTTEDNEPVADPVDDTTTTVFVDPTEPEEASQESIELWVMSGDGLDVAEWMGNIGVKAAEVGSVLDEQQMITGCQEMYTEFFATGDILSKMQTAPGELGVELEDTFFAYESGIRLCSEGDLVNAYPAIIKGTEHLNEAVAILNRYAP